MDRNQRHRRRNRHRGVKRVEQDTEEHIVWYLYYRNEEKFDWGTPAIFNQIRSDLLFSCVDHLRAIDSTVAENMSTWIDRSPQNGVPSIRFHLMPQCHDVRALAPIIYHGMMGVYWLLNRSDRQGLVSLGQIIDICNTVRIIAPQKLLWPSDFAHQVCGFLDIAQGYHSPIGCRLEFPRETKKTLSWEQQQSVMSRSRKNRMRQRDFEADTIAARIASEAASGAASEAASGAASEADAKRSQLYDILGVAEPDSPYDPLNPNIYQHPPSPLPVREAFRTENDPDQWVPSSPGPLPRSPSPLSPPSPFSPPSPPNTALVEVLQKLNHMLPNASNDMEKK